MENIASIFDKYGWPGLIVFMVCFGFSIYFKYFFKKTEKRNADTLENIGSQLTENLVNQNQAIIDALNRQNNKLVENLKDTNKMLFKEVLKDTEEKHDASLSYRTTGTDSVMDVIRELRAEVHADRTSILEFHNSNSNFGGLGFVAYDMKYERQKMGVTPISNHISGKDYAQIHWVVKQVNNSKSKVFRLNLTDNEKQLVWDNAPVLYDDLVNKIGAKHVIFAGIYNYSNAEIIGLLCTEYHEQMNEKDLKESEQSCANYASQLSAMLTFPSDYKKGDPISINTQNPQKKQ